MASKKGSKSTKGLTILLVILVIFLCAYLGYVFVQERNVIENDTNNTNTFTNSIERNTTNITNTNNTTNTTSQQTQNTNTQNSVQTDGPEIVGKEEQESNQETGGINLEEKAINLAKQKWGQNSEAYIFKVDYVEGDIYHVAIVSNAMIISYMDVNINTEEVTEY